MIDETEVIRLYVEEFMPMAAVAKQIGTYPVRVRRILKANNIPTRKKWARPLRRCWRCKERKFLDEFPTHKNKPGGKGYTCRQCETDHKRETWGHLRTYKITRADYDRILTEQGGVCAICKQPGKSSNRSERMAVDHDHATGEVRGLLCGTCNTLLGKLEQKPGWLISALTYLGQ